MNKTGCPGGAATLILLRRSATATMSQSRSKQGSVEWSLLPTELLHDISCRLTDPIDYVCFRAVCWPWRSAATPARLPARAQLPWLLLGPYELSTGAADFFSLSRANTRRIHLPEAHRKLCLGASRGWLVLQADSDAISLLNPVTRAHVHLPPFKTPELDGLVVRKAFLSSDPSSDKDCMVLLVLYSEILAFCSAEGRSWTITQSVRGDLAEVSGVAYYNGRFYALGRNGRLAFYNAESSSMESVENPWVKVRGVSRNYLVESSGELLLVVRYLHLDGTTNWFSVFKIDLCGQPEVIEVESIEERMLFVGPNNSFSLPAGYFHGFEGNCIYFVDEYRVKGFAGDVGCSVGVFSLEDGGIRKLPFDLGKLLLRSPGSQWIIPSVN